MQVPRRLYWTSDRSRLVEHGDPAAAFLAFSVGHELSDEEARRFGVAAFLAPAPVVDVESMGNAPVAVGKQRTRPLDKAAARPADKGITIEHSVIEEKTR